MSAIVNVVLPIFGLILAGYVCRRSGRLGEAASNELSRFVVWLALPALLFNVTATASWEQLWQPGFIASVCAGCALVFAATVALRVRKSGRLVDASIDGLSAAYANTGFLGIPLCALVFGDAGLMPAIVATLIVASRVRQLRSQVLVFARSHFQKCHYNSVSCSGAAGFSIPKA